jgi:chaperonin GroES
MHPLPGRRERWYGPGGRRSSNRSPPYAHGTRIRSVSSETGTVRPVDAPQNGAGTPDDPSGLPIRMLHDRVLVRLEGKPGERRSTAGIVIPATATMGRRLAWASAVAIGPHVRSIQVGDRVLFDPDDRSEVELQGNDYVLLRERDVHAVAAERVEAGATGLYL